MLWYLKVSLENACSVASHVHTHPHSTSVPQIMPEQHLAPLAFGGFISHIYIHTPSTYQEQALGDARRVAGLNYVCFSSYRSGLSPGNNDSTG